VSQRSPEIDVLRTAKQIVAAIDAAIASIDASLRDRPRTQGRGTPAPVPTPSP
jgi:hypothetical protein